MQKGKRFPDMRTYLPVLLHQSWQEYIDCLDSLPWVRHFGHLNKFWLIMQYVCFHKKFLPQHLTEFLKCLVLNLQGNLFYDQNNRNDSEPTSTSYYDLSSDNIPSRSCRSMSVDSQSHFKTLPYSRREQPYGLNNTATSDRKGSFGVSGITLNFILSTGSFCFLSKQIIDSA
jgi:hypothetical protein